MIEQEKIQVLESTIMEIAQQEAQAILDAARAKADSVRTQAEAKAVVESERILAGARQTVEKLIDQATAKAQLEAQMLKLQRREQALQRAFTKARLRLATIPERPDYTDIVRRLISEAVTYMGDAAFVIRTDAATRRVLDQTLLADLMQQLDVQLERGPQLEEGIGIVLTTPDGRRRYDNTLETRLARIQEDVRASVYHILAGDAV